MLSSLSPAPGNPISSISYSISRQNLYHINTGIKCNRPGRKPKVNRDITFKMEPHLTATSVKERNKNSISTFHFFFKIKNCAPYAYLDLSIETALLCVFYFRQINSTGSSTPFYFGSLHGDKYYFFPKRLCDSPRILI